MPDFLRLLGLQHVRLPCSSLTPKACSNSCPSSWWFHPTISSSVTPFSSCCQPFPASGSFLISWLCASGDEGIGASASLLPMNVQGWFLLGFPRYSQEFFPPPQFESINSSVLSLLVHIDSKDKHDIKVILHIGFPG